MRQLLHIQPLIAPVASAAAVVTVIVDDVVIHLQGHFGIVNPLVVNRTPAIHHVLLLTFTGKYPRAQAGVFPVGILPW